MKYESLIGIYHRSRQDHEREYDHRRNSPLCVLPGLEISGNEAFFMDMYGMRTHTEAIYDKYTKAEKLLKRLPPAILKEHERMCLADEIIISNELEGITVTEEEVFRIVEGDEKERLSGMVQAYCIMAHDPPVLRSPSDIRDLYDLILLDDIGEKERPDGDLFRKDRVMILSPSQRIRHSGLHPESAIIEALEKTLASMDRSDIHPLYRMAILHYMTGYIHPFYDGNGRLNRFMSSSLLMREFGLPAAFGLSRSIRNSGSRYYKAFDIVNSPLNMGDITPFIVYFIDIVEDIMDSILEGLR